MSKAIYSIRGDTKLCPSCKLWKPLTAFSRDKYKATGLHSFCKPCKNASVDPERARQKRKTWYQNNRERALSYAKTWNKQNPEKVKEYAKRHYQKQKNREDISE